MITVFWLTICKLNSACGKTFEEDTREQSRIPSTDSSKVIVAFAEMKKTQEEDCWCSGLDGKWHCLFFSFQTMCTHTPKACSWDGFQHELPQKAKKKKTLSVLAEMHDGWDTSGNHKGQTNALVVRVRVRVSWCRWCSVPSATPYSLNWKAVFDQPANWCSFDFTDSKSISPKWGKHNRQYPELSLAENKTHPSAFITQ